MNGNRRARWLRNLLCGVLIGAGGILPGVSGGVLAMVFGIYRPFMEVLTHPKRALPQYWQDLALVGLGCAAGFLAVAKGVSLALGVSEAATTWLFIGLIIGTVPALFREAGREGRGPAAWAGMAVCAAGVFASLFYVSHVAALHVEPDGWWYAVSGALCGLGVVIPGLSTSSVLMALDLYQPLMAGISGLDISVLLPALAGTAAAILLPARLVDWLFRRYNSIACHGILGIVLASALVIVPTRHGGPGEIAMSVLCGAGGFLLALFLGRLDRRSRKTNSTEGKGAYGKPEKGFPRH